MTASSTDTVASEESAAPAPPSPPPLARAGALDPALVHFRDLYREMFFEITARPDEFDVRPARRFEEQWRDLPKFQEYRKVPCLNWHVFADLASTPEFNVAARALDKALVGASARTIAIVSSNREEGRSAMALHVCRDQAFRLGRRVVLVDYDFQRRELMDVLPVTPIYAYKDVLEGRVDLESCGILSIADRFMVLPSTGQFPRDHMKGSGVEAFLRESIPDCIELIVFDMPPLRGQERTVTSLLRHVDAVLLIKARDDERQFRELLEAVRRARREDGTSPTVLGYIVNHVPG